MPRVSRRRRGDGLDQLTALRVFSEIARAGGFSKAARSGLGIARLPAFMVEDAIVAGELVELLPECRPDSEPVHAVYPAGRHLPQKVRLFSDFLAERLAPAGSAG